jgi:hypothetical protein
MNTDKVFNQLYEKNSTTAGLCITLSVKILIASPPCKNRKNRAARHFGTVKTRQYCVTPAFND